MLAFEPRHEHARVSARRQDEGDRPLGRDEGETAVVEDVAAVEENSASEPVAGEMLCERVQPLPVFVRADRERHAARSFSRQAGSSSRRRRTRSPIGGCVTKSAASPSSMNGLNV